MKLTGRLFSATLFLGFLVLNWYLFPFIVGAIRDSKYFLLTSFLSTFVVNFAICICLVYRLREPDEETLTSSNLFFWIPVTAISVTIGLFGLFMFPHQVYLKGLLIFISFLIIPLASHTRNWVQKHRSQSK